MLEAKWKPTIHQAFKHDLSGFSNFVLLFYRMAPGVLQPGSGLISIECFFITVILIQKMLEFFKFVPKIISK